MAFFEERKIFHTVIEANIFAKQVSGRVELAKDEKGENIYIVVYCS